MTFRRMGFKVIYDPAIAVDHRLIARVEETRAFGPEQVRHSAHNESRALLEYLSPTGKVAHILWSVGIGFRDSPGVAHSILSLVTTRDGKLALLRASIRGHCLAVLNYLRGL